MGGGGLEEKATKWWKLKCTQDMHSVYAILYSIVYNMKTEVKIVTELLIFFIYIVWEGIFFRYYLCG